MTIDENFITVSDGEKQAQFSSIEELVTFLKSVPFETLVKEFNNTGIELEWKVTDLFLSIAPSSFKKTFSEFVERTPESHQDEWYGIINYPQEDEVVEIEGVSATLSFNHWGGGYFLKF